jgi:hypothetical protein
MTPSSRGSDGRVVTGQVRDYWWLTSRFDDYMGTLVRLCPEVILGRHLAVITFDGGTPCLTERQKGLGWQWRSAVAYSPPIQSVDELCYERCGSPGYDEWYLFDRATDIPGRIIEGNPFEDTNMPGPDNLLRFVGWLGFTIDSDQPSHHQLRDWFWAQIERIRPESYVSDGQDSLTFVSRNAAMFERVHERLRR